MSWLNIYVFYPGLRVEGAHRFAVFRNYIELAEINHWLSENTRGHWCGCTHVQASLTFTKWAITEPCNYWFRDDLDAVAFRLRFPDAFPVTGACGLHPLEP